MALRAYSCSSEDFLQEGRRWRRTLSSVLDGTAALRVSQVYVPASAADTSGAIAAFPNADEYTFTSLEPSLPPRGIESLQAALKSSLEFAAALRAIFACSRGGGYMLGYQVRAFAREWGLLPLLLVSLGMSDTRIQSARQVTHGWEFECCCRETSRPIQASTNGKLCRDGGRPCIVTYMSLNLTDERSARSFVQHMHARKGAARRRQKHRNGWLARAFGMSQQTQIHVAGVLIKGAETLFRADLQAGPQKVRLALSRGVLNAADVILQDTVTGIRWELVKAWAPAAQGRFIPFGAYAPDSDGESAEARALEHLWKTSLRRGTWRTFRGLRFGYCNIVGINNATLIEGRQPRHERAAQGANDPIERRQAAYCSAVLIYRRGVMHQDLFGGR